MTVEATETRSFLDRVRHNRAGSLVAALLVSVVLGLLLSTLVPSRPQLVPVVILGVVLALAVGFTVRATSHCRGLKAQAAAGVSTALGTHLMVASGLAGGGGGMMSAAPLTAGGSSFGDSVLIALALPVVSSGALLTGLIAVAVVAWGERHDGEHYGKAHGHHYGQDHGVVPPEATLTDEV